MDTFFGSLGAPVMLLMGAFVGITALLWFLLPFSVFGIKARLDEQIEMLRLIEQRLALLNQAIPPLQQASPILAPTAASEDLETQDSQAPEPAAAHATEVPPAPRNGHHDERWRHRG